MAFSDNLRCLFALLTVFSFLGTVFLIIGVFGPAWYYTGQLKLKDGPWEMQEGLWLARYCNSDEPCVMGSREEIYKETGVTISLSSIDQSDWTKYKVLSIFSILGAVICLICSVLALVKTVHKRCLQTHIALLICATVGSILSFSTILNPIIHIAASSRQNHLKSCWSLILGATSVGCELVATVLAQLALFQLCGRYQYIQRHRSRRERSQRHNEQISRYLQDCACTGNDTSSNGNAQSTYDRLSNSCSRISNTGNDNPSTVSHESSIWRLNANTNQSDNGSVSLSNVPPKYSALPSYGEITVT